MSTWRYRTPLSRPALWNVNSDEDNTRSAFLDRVIDREGDTGERSILSVVVPAKNEAANLPQLMDEIVRALRPLRGSRACGLTGI